MSPTYLAGIDVSAKTLSVALESPGAEILQLEFRNNPAGHRRLLKRLTKKGRRARVVLEATGVYSLDVALALHRDASTQVMVVNPRAAANFARATLQRAKNDAADALVLLEFVRRMDFQEWTPPTTEQLELRALSRRISTLNRMRTQERQRLHAAEAAQELPRALRRDIEVNLRHLERRAKRLQAQALERIQEDEGLSRALDLLLSIKGIGEASGVQILAELTMLPETMGPRQWVAHAGLDPRQHLSGSSVRTTPRISKTGNVHLRRALFMPAMVASRHEPAIRRYYERLLSRGKKPLQALVAIMRKLLHAIYGMLQRGEEFRGDKFTPTESQAA